MSQPFFKLFNGGPGSGRYVHGSVNPGSVQTGHEMRQSLEKKGLLDIPHGERTGKLDAHGSEQVDYSKLPDDKLAEAHAYHKGKEEEAGKSRMDLAGKPMSAGYIQARNTHSMVAEHHEAQRKQIEDEQASRKGRSPLSVPNLRSFTRFGNMRADLRKEAESWNGYLPNRKHVTKKEIDLARQLLPAPDVKNIGNGHKRQVVLKHGVSKGKKITFEFKPSWTFNNNRNGTYAGKWISPVAVEDDKFLEE